MIGRGTLVEVELEENDTINEKLEEAAGEELEGSAGGDKDDRLESVSKEPGGNENHVETLSTLIFPVGISLRDSKHSLET